MNVIDNSLLGWKIKTKNDWRNNKIFSSPSFDFLDFLSFNFYEAFLKRNTLFI